MKSKWKTSSGNLGGLDQKRFCLGWQWWEGCWGDREVALWLHVKGRFRRGLSPRTQGSLGEAGQGSLWIWRRLHTATR